MATSDKYRDAFQGDPSGDGDIEAVAYNTFLRDLEYFTSKGMTTSNLIMLFSDAARAL